MMRLMSSLFVVSLIAALPAFGASVKRSSSDICHDQNSSHFDRTKNFVAHETMEDCLQFGRAYKGYNGSAKSLEPVPVSQDEPVPSAYGIPEYDRGLYAHWSDADGDCMDTRHETLSELSTGPVRLTGDGCAVSRGRWLDPYTDQIFVEARDLDIDHMVPLYYAHQRGAHAWPADLKEAFANDPVNLFAVEAAANRQKGAQGPLEWLPPNEEYRCEYVTRFHRIFLTYKLQYLPGEREQIDALRDELCQ